MSMIFGILRLCSVALATIGGIFIFIYLLFTGHISEIIIILLLIQLVAAFILFKNIVLIKRI